MVNLSKLSEQLKELMAEKSLNQTELAKALNTPRSKLSSYCTARSAPNYTCFLALIDFFRCSADFLLGLSEKVDEDIAYRTPQAFSVRLRALLQERGISQYKLVKDCKLSWNVLHGWLTGKTLPSLDNLLRLAEFFEISIDELLGRI